MKMKICKFCGDLFSSNENGVDQEYCQPMHRQYENTYRWLKRKKESGKKRAYQSEVLDEDTKKNIKKAVAMTISHYGDTLKKLAKQ